MNPEPTMLEPHRQYRRIQSLSRIVRRLPGPLLRAAALLAILLPQSAARAADTVRVVTHSGVTVVTDPSKGSRSYPAWGLFPSADFSVRKATMRIRFGCPDSMRCADWDYLDHIVVRRIGGQGALSADEEIGRMLTPYGGAFGRDWSFGWSVDVTDFAMLLRDSVEVDYVHTGYEPDSDRGWRISVEFEFIEGPPPARAVSFTKIHDGVFPYGDSARPIGASLAPVSFTAAEGADFVRLLVFQTGHGGDDSGCGEFCDKYREILFDGKVADRKQIWKKCGENPLSPQAGTWIYDRANWCPGDLLAPDAYDFPVSPGSAHTVDIEMEPYLLPGTQANEAVTAYLVQYERPRAENDAAVTGIVVPSLEDIYLRSNPACSGPRVVVRNNGSRTLTSVHIRYGTIGFQERAYLWKGNLPFNASAVVELPGDIPARAGTENIFRVRISEPNGEGDGWEEDNEMTAPFAPTPAFTSPLVFLLKTNNEPSQSSWTLTDGDGTLIRDAKPGTLPPDSVVSDTFRLEPGCYRLSLNDSAGDGLEFWYNVRGGRGYARLFDGAGRMLKNFESDFGSSVSCRFRVSDDPGNTSPPAGEPAIGLFPTRTLGITTMDYFANVPEDVTVKIVTDPGAEVVEVHSYPALTAGSFTYDLTSRGPQRYYLKVFAGDALKFNKRIRVVEKLD